MISFHVLWQHTVVGHIFAVTFVYVACCLAGWLLCCFYCFWLAGTLAKHARYVHVILKRDFGDFQKFLYARSRRYLSSGCTLLLISQFLDSVRALSGFRGVYLCVFRSFLFSSFLVPHYFWCPTIFGARFYAVLCKFLSCHLVTRLVDVTWQIACLSSFYKYYLRPISLCKNVCEIWFLIDFFSFFCMTLYLNTNLKRDPLI